MAAPLKAFVISIIGALQLSLCEYGFTAEALYERECWQIESPPGETRWGEIHHAVEAEKYGIAHVTVLSRKTGDPIWAAERVVPHLAITTEALRVSVLKPIKNGKVYPEAFEEGFRKWKEDEARGKAFVCEVPWRSI